MFEVRNEHDDVVYKSPSERLAKIHAEYLHINNPKIHYRIFSISQVWTTQTLSDDYLSSYNYELVRKLR